MWCALHLLLEEKLLGQHLLLQLLLLDCHLRLVLHPHSVSVSFSADASQL